MKSIINCAFVESINDASEDVFSQAEYPAFDPKEISARNNKAHHPFRKSFLPVFLLAALAFAACAKKKDIQIEEKNSTPPPVTSNATDFCNDKILESYRSVLESSQLLETKSSTPEAVADSCKLFAREIGLTKCKIKDASSKSESEISKESLREVCEKAAPGSLGTEASPSDKIPVEEQTLISDLKSGIRVRVADLKTFSEFTNSETKFIQFGRPVTRLDYRRDYCFFLSSSSSLTQIQSTSQTTLNQLKVFDSGFMFMSADGNTILGCDRPWMNKSSWTIFEFKTVLGSFFGIQWK